MSLIAYLNPIAIKDSSISGSKLQNASIPGAKLQENTIAVSKIISLAQSITWSDLKAKRDEGKLIPGAYYRITDYECTTTQDNTKSVGHQFDIIVRADDVNVLNEECWAAQHEGDTYFTNSNLSAWKIWYCLDNDDKRFAWTSLYEELIGKIKPTEYDGSGTYTFNKPIYKITFAGTSYNLKIGVKTQIHEGPPVYATKTDDYTLVIEDKHNYVASQNEISVYAFLGKGVIYRMIDEWNNDVPYDFKNIQFKHPNDPTTYPHYYYTFASGNVEANTDCSLRITNKCYSNTIKEYLESGKRTLNNILFIGSSCYDNAFDSECHDNAFGSECHDNAFGSECHDNAFGSNCNYNTFGSECHDNAFGSNCNYNTFGSGCFGNTFGSNCHINTFGSSCFNNIFGSGCYNNTFGSSCHGIKFASGSSAATKYNYYQNNHFGDGCKYIIFKGAETASFFDQVQNYNFSQGLQGTSDNYLTIDGVRNLSYETKVAKNSSGELKLYCEADLMN